MVRRADMDREASAPSSLRNSRPTTSPHDDSRPMTTIAADAATIAKCFPDHRPSPATMAIFGAAGDLTKRLIVPALYNLVRGGKLPDGFAIIGIDHNDQTTEEWCQSLTEMMQAFARAGGRERQGGAIDQQAWSWLTRRMHYMRGDFTQPETYRQLGELLTDQAGRPGGSATALFYLAVGDRFFGPVIDQLGRAGLVRQSDNAWRRVVIEKPFFQLLAMIAMEPPISFDADAVRAKKTELFRAIHPISPADAVRGQYGAGVVLGKKVRDYRHEPDVAPDSSTETYVALKLGIDNWRWAGVPFYLRTGKYLSARNTEIAVQFRQAPYALFRDTPVERLPANILTLRIQPDEGLSLSFSAKRPGAEIEIDGVEMDFAYRDYFAPLASVGYETLIYDCLIGDATLFQRADTVEAAWCAVQGILDAWARAPADDFPNYAAGSAGPAAADRLLARDGHAWLPIAPGHPHAGRGA